jgi:hypothetical protein
VAQVFEHWVFMAGKRAGSTMFGPARRRAIASALAMGYTVEHLCLAVEGAAAEDLSWMRAGDTARATRRDLPTVLRDETVIEAYMEQGEALRERAAAMASRAHAERQDAPARPAVSPEEVAAAKEALKRLAARMRGAGGG